MYCSKCGLQLTNDAKFCVRCGKKMLGYSGSRMNAIDPEDFKDPYEETLQYDEMVESVLMKQMQNVGNIENKRISENEKVRLQPSVYETEKIRRRDTRVVLDEVKDYYAKKRVEEAEVTESVDSVEFVELGTSKQDKQDLILTSEGVIQAMGGHLGGTTGSMDTFTLVGMPNLDRIEKDEKSIKKDEAEGKEKDPVKIFGSVILYLLIGLATFTLGIILKAIFM